MSTVLIAGANGQLGLDVAERFGRESQHHVVALGRSDLDVSSRDQVLQVVGAVRPDIIVNAAAYTAVDKAESDVAAAYLINATGARNLAEAATRSGAHLVHVSTDYVFDGSKSSPYHEWDVVNPRSVYGASKAAGESEVAAHAPTASVLRTAWVCGPHGSNMLKTAVRLLTTTDNVLSFVTDQIGCPTFTDDLADAVYRAAIARAPGVFHTTNTGSDSDVVGASWFEFVDAIATSIGAGSGRVKPIVTAELDPPRPAPRPANSVLAPLAWRAAGFGDLPSWRDALANNLKRLSQVN